MIFGGFQKLTLLDFPGTVACTLFTRGCNFLCPFCHNAPLVNKLSEAAEYSEDEVLSFLEKRRGVLEGVCITGGEPLLHKDLKSFIKKVKDLGYKVKLDTNGSFPDRLYELISEGLVDYVAMDIKNSFDKYCITAGNDNVNINDIEKSIDILLHGDISYEFRTTVTHELHTVDDIEKIAQRITGAEKYYLQNFSDSGNLVGQGFSAVNPKILAKMCEEAGKFTRICKSR